jgi:hypothetical protein
VDPNTKHAFSAMQQTSAAMADRQNLLAAKNETSGTKCGYDLYIGHWSQTSNSFHLKIVIL